MADLKPLQYRIKLVYKEASRYDGKRWCSWYDRSLQTHVSLVFTSTCSSDSIGQGSGGKRGQILTQLKRSLKGSCLRQRRNKQESNLLKSNIFLAFFLFFPSFSRCSFFETTKSTEMPFFSLGTGALKRFEKQMAEIGLIMHVYVSGFFELWYDKIMISPFCFTLSLSALV